MRDLPDDFRDLLVSLADAKVRFLVVGGYAVAFHGHARATKDLDIYVEPGADNAARVERGLTDFGAPLRTLGIRRDDFEHPGTIVQLGVPPLRIDLLTTADGISFDEAWSSRDSLEIDGRTIAVIGHDALIKNKLASGRHQDLADVEALRGDH
ncbi:MAG: nucleotidyltransferase [Myxococcota bacterium]